MDNVVSIFTKKEPCEKLLLSNEEFKKFFDTNWAGTHFWYCEDCIKRYTNANRYALAEALEKQAIAQPEHLED